MHALFTSEAIPGLRIESPVVQSVDRVVPPRRRGGPSARLLWSEWVSLGSVLLAIGVGFARRLRHFIRFKVERDRVIGYVIGFDRPCRDVGLGQASVRALAARKDGAPTLQVKLIDRFERTPGRDAS